MAIGAKLQRWHRNFGRVWARDRGIWQYCGAEGESVDHVVPWAYRPDNSLGNLVVACMPCNLAASDKVFPSFTAKRRHIIEARGMLWTIPVLASHVAPRPRIEQQSRRRLAPIPRPGTGLPTCVRTECVRCGEVFGDVESFEAHSPNLECLPPTTVGMRKTGSGLWWLESSLIAGPSDQRVQNATE
jgi:hypothetical protein